MINKNLFAILLIILLVYSCSPDDSPSGFDPNFDHTAQALKDRDSISNFLQSYYFDSTTETLKKVTGGQTPLINDTRLSSVDVTEEEVDYTLYYLKLREGNPNPVKGFPSVMDSVLTIYTGQYIVNNDSILEFEKRATPVWLLLNSVIRGWTYTLPNFKGGRNITTSGPIEYVDGGKGIAFIPSGLAYRNLGVSPTAIGSVGIPANSNLIFYFDLYDIVENTDLDNDSIPSILEDPDGDGDPRNDDTDGDRIPNYLDQDDDNDGILTKDEDANGDGDPTNDFSDPNNPTLPDYLNPDIT